MVDKRPLNAKHMNEAPTPYEWPGSYFLGEEELAAATSVLNARSPFRFYGPHLQGYTDRLEKAYCEGLGRNYALSRG